MHRTKNLQTAPQLTGEDAEQDGADVLYPEHRGDQLRPLLVNKVLLALGKAKVHYTVTYQC